MKTIAELLKHDFKKGSLYLYDSNGNKIYYEDSDGYWEKREYDSKGNQIYYEDSDGFWIKRADGNITDNRPKQSCDGKIVEIEGRNYKLVELD
jgi:hypothetical protein